MLSQSVSCTCILFLLQRSKYTKLFMLFSVIHHWRLKKLKIIKASTLKTSVEDDVLSVSKYDEGLEEGAEWCKANNFSIRGEAPELNTWTWTYLMASRGPQTQLGSFRTVTNILASMQLFILPACNGKILNCYFPSPSGLTALKWL